MTLAVSKGMSEEYMYVPLILAGFGHVSVFIVLTVYAQAKANFQYYFQTLCLLGFIRTGIGGPIYDHIRVAVICLIMLSKFQKPRVTS